jgi:hypothetical protein
MTEATGADPHIVRAYREQTSLYREAMKKLLMLDAGQAATFVAVQAVRSAASYALAMLTGRVADDEDTVAALWRAVPAVRELAVLHDDLTLYAYSVDGGEAREIVDAADLFCAWAQSLAPAPAAATRVQSIRT